ncbi:DUF4091 domain-containing protein [Vallitalea sp.]|uniref:DUF4091 domain-containing protein n=1 Tax=Vallitalea sp. TaxID=1882829 RepID=UPI0025D7EA4A|nr:DUF4091 domain-containing protein [Vallitalea sp.]MCT4687659.1 DUF4091 domain-containing protein [Vallitalea sp.]
MDKIFIARLFDELEPCYPDTIVSQGNINYCTSGANGSYAGVNILISGITPGIPITIKVNGPHTGYKLFNMIPVPVEVNTGAKQRSEYLKNDYNEHVIRRAPFMVYDALEPINSIIMPTTTTCGINFKAIIEYVKENNRQEWEFIITHGQNIIKLNYQVDVYKVTVPKTTKQTFKYINWINYNNIASYHNIQKWSPEYELMLEKYFRTAVYSRQNMLNLPLEEFFDITNNSLTLNIKRLKKVISIARKSGIQWFHGTALCYRSEGLEDNDDFYNSLNHELLKHTDQVAEAYKKGAFDAFDNGKYAKTIITAQLIPSEEGDNTLRQITSQINDFIEENNLTDYYMQCALDEPNDALADTYKHITNIIKEEMPNISILEPVLPTNKIEDSLDIWCPSIDVYEQNKTFYDEQVKKGNELFTYTCLTPGGNYINRLLDMERIRIVWIGWAPAKYTNIKGFLHWGANQYVGGIDPYKRQAVMFSEQVLEFHPKRANFLPAGDYCIFYPGFNEPLISIRSEAHRIGFEDLCLLQQLEAIDNNKKNSILLQVFRNYSDYEKSIEKYRQAKKELLESLV